MATFTALNIEPDDQSDDEIDNTKEIQIEEALKLYQAALKLHSQGPKLYSQAKEAYAVLFKSEVFRYPESVTDFTRAEEHPEIEYTDASFALGLDTITTGEGVPSTLPQILYLSYKNHGQFIMDCVKFGLKHSERNSAGAVEIRQLEPQSNNALVDFSRALAADESDTELWRRAARLGALMGSRRIARYCLEAAVEVDDDPTVAEVDPASLEEGFAGEQLKEQLEVLSDQISLTHPIMGPFIKRPMPPYLTKYMDPYSFLPNPITSLDRPQLSNNGAEVTTAYTVIQPIDGTWERLGVALFQQVSLSPGGLPGVRVLIDLPGMGSNNSHPQSILRTTSFPDSTRREWEGHATPDEGKANDDIEPTPEDQIMKEVASASSYTPPTGSNEVTNPLSGPPNDITKPQEPIPPQSSIAQDSEPSQAEPIVLPTRKRSQSVAGLRETPEDDSGTQKRSKRIRNRADPATETAVDPATQFAEQLKAFEQADAETFRFVGSNLRKLGVDDLGTFEELHTAFSLQGDSDLTEKVANTAVRDLRDILKTWDDGKASTFLNSSPADMLGSLNGPVNSGIAAFLEHSNAGPLKVSNLPPFVLAEGLFSFMRRVENDWMTLQDVIFEWVCVILRTYRRMQWQDDLKIIFVQLICYTDADIFGRLHADMASFYGSTIHSQERIMECEDLVQSLFELHLDVYSRITNPGSIVHHDTRVMTKERLDRWADFAADVVRSRPRKSYDEISLRYLWASVFYATTAEYVSREHKVLCWSELKTLLQECERPAIELQNNAVMPEISIAAAEREVNRLTTMDFFFNLFRTDNTDPVAIIETLEPVLDPESAIQQASPDLGDSRDSSAMELSAGTESVSSSLREMWKFLKAGSISLRLFLWQRLREAYVSIDYSTKVFSCHLKSLEIIVAHFRSEEYVESPEEPRRHKMLTWLKALDDLLVRALSIALNDSERCFEIIDERHITSTCAALAQLSRILHAAAMFDDQVRVGMIQLPNRPAFGERGNFTSLTTKLKEMQVRTWALQYAMVKEGMNQSPENFPTSDMDLADYLAVVHYGLGLRKCCRASNKIFLKMMKVEMLRMTHVDRWEDYLGQVLFDLYGVRLGVGTWDLDDHGCTTETLDRRTALNIAEQVIMLANRMPMKDLLKDELRPTIEKMQAALGPSKSTPQMQHNLRNYTEYLKTSIRPLHMYQALKGQVQVDSLPVVKLDTSLADKRWYFLLGMMNLTKFRAQKRLAPGTQQDDLRIAASFLRIQLQHTADDWETWYRLAQCFDLELEEEVLWTADKINNSRRQLIILQRSSIHCYIMALSTAVRNAQCTLETAEKLSEMYHDFGMRIYASSREPFDNEAFWVEDFEKHMSGHQGMYKRALHDEMSKYKVWKYASNLFKKALIEKPRNWMSHYMLGKCQWKMYCKAPDDDRDRASRPSMWSPLNSFLKAIETVPKQRDSRAEPVLEPHYKLISSVHKLIVLGDMDMQEGANLLQQQPFAINKGGEVVIKDQEEWNDFMLRAFRQVRQADKSHWHHRMVARVVRILYDPDQPNAKRAAQARHEFQTSILTKTMHVQVWKPDAERPGRHHVYMERYVRLIIKILWNLEDKAGMEALTKRVRKRAGDYFRYHIVWQECCTAYLRLIRRLSKIPANMDEVFKGVPHEEFEILSDRLNNWIADPHQSHPALDALRETIELKKLNQNLMKGLIIDDAINDAWAVLYTEVARTLPGPEPSNMVGPGQLDGESSTRAQGPMSLNNLVMNMDGSSSVSGSPGFAVLAAAPSGHPLGSIDASQRPRRVGIRRTEIIKRAEGAIARAGDPPRNTVSSTSQRRSSHPAVVLESTTIPLLPVATTVSTPPPRLAYSDLRAEAKDDSSAPGSVHDSADDESDLSDVPDMDDAEAETIFPNLMRKATGTPAKDGDVMEE